MNNKRLTMTTMVVLILFLSIALVADTLSVKKCVNSTGSWCWAGAMECVVKFYDQSAISKSQKQIVSHITTKPKEEPSTKRILEGLKKSLISLNITVTEFPLKPTEQDFKDQADSNNVIYLLHSWPNGGYHASVYVGYIGERHYVMDPWASPTPYKIRSYRQLITPKGLKWQRCFKFKRPLDPTSIFGNNTLSSNNYTNFSIIYNKLPFRNTISIVFNSLPQNKKIVKIFNMRGGCVYENHLDNTVIQTHLNVSNTLITSGMYVVDVTNVDNNFSNFKSSESKKQTIFMVK